MTLGFDIGGTWIKVGIVAPDGTVVDADRFATPHGVDAVIDGIASAIAGRPAMAVGIGIAGVVQDGGVVRHPPNLPGWTTVPLQHILEERTGRTVRVDNDANAAAMAEAVYGAGRERPTFLYVTVGTGIGGAIVRAGRIDRGATGGAGELGHVVVRMDAADSRTGFAWRAGTVEEYAGIAGIEAAAGMPIAALAEALGRDDTAARRVVADAADVLAAGLASAMAVTGIADVIVGGGLADALPLVEALAAPLRRRMLPSLADVHTLQRATFGNTAGIIGAAALAHRP